MGFRLTLPRRLEYPSAAHEDLHVTHQRDNFHFCMAWAMAIAVFVGFGRRSGRADCRIDVSNRQCQKRRRHTR